MAIRLISAVYIKETDTDTIEGRVALLDPDVGFSVPVTFRDQMVAKGQPSVDINMHDREIVLLLWGGTPGEEYNITGSLSISGQPPSPLTNAKFVWPDNAPNLRISMQLTGKLRFYGSGIYEVRLTVNGDPLGALPFVMWWEDETDF